MITTTMKINMDIFSYFMNITTYFISYTTWNKKLWKLWLIHKSLEQYYISQWQLLNKPQNIWKKTDCWIEPVVPLPTCLLSLEDEQKYMDSVSCHVPYNWKKCTIDWKSVPYHFKIKQSILACMYFIKFSKLVSRDLSFNIYLDNRRKP